MELSEVTAPRDRPGGMGASTVIRPHDQRPSRRAHAGMRHPLLGANLSLLVRMLLTSGPIRLADAPLVAIMLLSAAARAPIAAYERRLFTRRLRMTGETPGSPTRCVPSMPAPVFIVGHWRSGTTHLHNLLGCSPRFGHISPIAAGLPEEILTLGAWFRPWLERALPEDRHVDRVAVRPESPQEDEIPLSNLQPCSIFHAIYFPKRFQELANRGVFFDGCDHEDVRRWERLAQAFLAKISMTQNGKPLLIKNVVYTARISALRRIWPEARFIHIRRNPYEVFLSTVNYYRRLLSDLALQPYDHLDIESFTLSMYTRMMDRYLIESENVPPSRLAEVSYEELVRSPLEVLGELHEQLSLPGWDETRPHVAAYLETIKDYRTNEFTLSAHHAERIRDAWGPYIERWNYQPPNALTPA